MGDSHVSKYEWICLIGLYMMNEWEAATCQNMNGWVKYERMRSHHVVLY